MKQKYVVALDQGTTSSRAALFDEKGKLIDIVQQEYKQSYPKDGWVEQDPFDILHSQEKVLMTLFSHNDLCADKVISIGITNQRETTILWNKETGQPIYPAIVWQDKRSSTICEQLQNKIANIEVNNRTGLLLDAYFSASKIRWILDHVPESKQLIEENKLLFGTVDSWLIWNLSKEKHHVTDVTNASRTLLYNINTLEWDDYLLDLFDIPKSILPKVLPSAADFGHLNYKEKQIPINAILGDQQAALFGQACFEKGMTKNTYGTGCFMLTNTGKQPLFSKNGLLTTIAWQLDGETFYALEGSVFIAGAAIKWLRDGLKIIKTAEESETLAKEVSGENPVYVVPSFAGLGAPYWDNYARGAIFGLTQETGREHVVKATLASLAYQTKDLINSMQEDCDLKLEKLHVDGGACVNNVLLQFQADIANIPIIRFQNTESTVTGVAYMAGIYQKLWTKEIISKNKIIETSFEAQTTKLERKQLYEGWLKAVKRSMGWNNPE